MAPLRLVRAPTSTSMQPMVWGRQWREYQHFTTHNGVNVVAAGFDGAHGVTMTMTRIPSTISYRMIESMSWRLVLMARPAATAWMAWWVSVGSFGWSWPLFVCLFSLQRRPFSLPLLYSRLREASSWRRLSTSPLERDLTASGKL